MHGVYLYLAIIILVIIFLGVKYYRKKKQAKQDYDEREENVFYDTAKHIRRD